MIRTLCAAAGRLLAVLAVFLAAGTLGGVERGTLPASALWLLLPITAAAVVYIHIDILKNSNRNEKSDGGRKR